MNNVISSPSLSVILTLYVSPSPSLSVILTLYVSPSPSLSVIPREARNLSIPLGINSARNLGVTLGTMPCIGFLVACAPRNDKVGASFKGLTT